MPTWHAARVMRLDDYGFPDGAIGDLVIFSSMRRSRGGCARARPIASRRQPGKYRRRDHDDAKHPPVRA